MRNPAHSKSFAWVIGAGTLAAIGWTVAARSAPDAPDKAAQIERGRYLVQVMACGDCHSPHDETGKPIPGRELTGHPEGAPLPEWDPAMLRRNIIWTTAPTLTAWAGPFGVSVAGNLTPDKETGIGTLTEEGLIHSWRTGNHWKPPHRPVLPPMPIPTYRNVTDDDIRAIYAYLMSLKPVRNNFPSSRPAQP